MKRVTKEEFEQATKGMQHLSTTEESFKRKHNAVCSRYGRVYMNHYSSPLLLAMKWVFDDRIEYYLESVACKK